MSTGSFRSALVAALLTLMTAATVVVPLPAYAQNASFLSGTITAGGTAVAGATVTLTGSGTTVRATTDAHGRFAFPALPVGGYTLTAQHGAQSATEHVDVGSAGADVTLSLDRLQTIGRTAVSARTTITQRSGADTVLNTATLSKTARSSSFSEVLLAQVPGTARGANGVVHINGDHGDLNYVVDGVPLPIEINRAIGNEFDPGNIAFAEVLQGAFPAQYGLRFGAVVNIGTPSNPGPGGTSLDVKAGSFGLFDSTVTAHAPLGSGGSYVVSLRNSRDGRALDPPHLGSPNDVGSDASQLVRFTIPRGSTYYNLTLTHALQTFQIPVDVLGTAGAPQPASLDDTQRQDDLYAGLQVRRAIGDRGSFSFGPSYKRSRLLDTGDPANDLAPALRDPQAPPQGPPTGGGTPALCVNANASALYRQGSPTGALADCALSVNADRTSVDGQFTADYALRSAQHEVRAGGLYDVTHVSKAYTVTLQPENFIAGAGNGPATVRDNAPNVGHTESVYVQDAWKPTRRLTFDAGLRADAFQIGSTQFKSAFAQISPRLKATLQLGPRSSVYGYYGRFFTPFSFENVSPSAAATLNPPAPGNPPAGFDLRPQRDSVYELGGFVRLGAGQLGLRAMQKNSTDVIDDVVVGLTNLHQDINYGLGRISVMTLAFGQPLPRNSRFTASISYDRAYVKNCETQLLAQCIGQAADWIPADHDQRWDAATSVLLQDRRGGYFSFGAEYGSGLSTAPTDLTVDPTISAPAVNPLCPPGPGGVGSSGCKSPPHVLLDAEHGFTLRPGTTLSLGVQNITNDRNYVTYANAQGFHTLRPRTFTLRLKIER